MLNADDVKAALAEASEIGDEQTIALWQERLLEAAEQVNLKPSELKLISGKQGIVFLQFQGMKTNYQRDFEHAFYEFGDVDAVYSEYPAFESLHANSQDLVIKRDALIDSIALELGFQGLNKEESLAEARRRWQQLMNAESVPSTSVIQE